jgi:hypothetical protein
LEDARFITGADAVPARRCDRCAMKTRLERSAPAGAMAPLHRRDEDETYEVLAGRVTFFVDGYVVEAGPGNLVVALAGVERTFRSETDDARWLVITQVESLPDYVDFARAVAPPLADPRAGWPSAEELRTLTAMAAANGITLLGPPGAVPEERVVAAPV